MTTRNEARRFITLVDALYECKTKLYADFALPMERLFIDVCHVLSRDPAWLMDLSFTLFVIFCHHLSFLS